MLRRFDKVGIGEVRVARRGMAPAMPEKLADEGQTFSRHHRLTRGGMAQVVQAQAAELRIRADRAPARGAAARRSRSTVSAYAVPPARGDASGQLHGQQSQPAVLVVIRPVHNQRHGMGIGWMAE